MIRVTVEILPGGNASRAVTIATADVSNISNLAAVSDYACSVQTAGYDKLAIAPEAHSFLIREHRRADGVIKLLRRVFQTAENM